jgi:hypothetical protein
MIIPSRADSQLNKMMKKYHHLYTVGGKRHRPDKCKEYLLRSALEKAYRLGVEDGK